MHLISKLQVVCGPSWSPLQNTTDWVVIHYVRRAPAACSMLQSWAQLAAAPMGLPSPMHGAFRSGAGLKLCPMGRGRKISGWDGRMCVCVEMRSVRVCSCRPSSSQHKANGVPVTLWGCSAPLFLMFQAYLEPTHLRLHGYGDGSQGARMQQGAAGA